MSEKHKQDGYRLGSQDAREGKLWKENLRYLGRSFRPDTLFFGGEGRHADFRAGYRQGAEDARRTIHTTTAPNTAEEKSMGINKPDSESAIERLQEPPGENYTPTSGSGSSASAARATGIIAATRSRVSSILDGGAGAAAATSFTPSAKASGIISDTSRKVSTTLGGSAAGATSYTPSARASGIIADTRSKVSSVLGSSTAAATPSTPSTQGAHMSQPNLPHQISLLENLKTSLGSLMNAIEQTRIQYSDTLNQLHAAGIVQEYEAVARRPHPITDQQMTELRAAIQTRDIPNVEEVIRKIHEHMQSLQQGRQY